MVRPSGPRMAGSIAGDLVRFPDGQSVRDFQHLERAIGAHEPDACVAVERHRVLGREQLVPLHGHRRDGRVDGVVVAGRRGSTASTVDVSRSLPLGDVLGRAPGAPPDPVLVLVVRGSPPIRQRRPRTGRPGTRPRRSVLQELPIGRRSGKSALEPCAPDVVVPTSPWTLAARSATSESSCGNVVATDVELAVVASSSDPTSITPTTAAPPRRNRPPTPCPPPIRRRSHRSRCASRSSRRTSSSDAPAKMTSQISCGSLRHDDLEHQHRSDGHDGSRGRASVGRCSGRRTRRRSTPGH